MCFDVSLRTFSFADLTAISTAEVVISTVQFSIPVLFTFSGFLVYTAM